MRYRALEAATATDFRGVDLGGVDLLPDQVNHFIGSDFESQVVEVRSFGATQLAHRLQQTLALYVALFHASRLPTLMHSKKPLYNPQPLQIVQCTFAQ